jgi:hypothetical protein
VLRRVGLGLPRVPLEHAFSIYESLGSAAARRGSHAYGGAPERTP